MKQQKSQYKHQIQLQQSKIDITNISNLEDQVNDSNAMTITLAFSFNTDILAHAKKVTKLSGKKINPIVDLEISGAITMLERTLILSLGEKKTFNLKTYLKALKSLATYLSNNKKITKINLLTEEYLAELLQQKVAYHIEQTLFHLVNFLYYFDELKSKRKELSLKNINLITEGGKSSTKSIDYTNAIHNAISLLEGLFLIKHLANNPANIVTPTYLADTANNLAHNIHNTQVEILNKPQIQKLNMNAFLSVAKGSVEEPKFIKLIYNGAKTLKQKPIVLIGKGITFDSGGISIKPSANMDNMKFDMCGAATVIGVFKAAAELKLPLNLICLVPSCENMPSGTANKPGDIVTTMSGQSVEIVNTDAEGRLILCDALTYAAKLNPELVIDLATLTGACVIALGNIASGLYSNDEGLSKEITDAASKTLDKVWAMPLFEEYFDMLKSPFADLCNIGSWKGAAGSVTAAAFLAKFVEYKWAHLDIAGTADGESIYNSNNYNAATGRPFYLLMEFLRNKCSLA